MGRLDQLLARYKKVSRRPATKKKKAKKKGKKKSKKKAAGGNPHAPHVSDAYQAGYRAAMAGLSRKSAPKASGGKKQRSPAQIAATKRMLAGLKRSKKNKGR